MVNKCCAPGCKSNYRGTTKVAIFGFPKNEELKMKWVNQISRKDFVPTKYSKVCEKHFHPADIISGTTYVDPRTGKKLTCKFKSKTYLRPKAIPMYFDTHLSTDYKKWDGESSSEEEVDDNDSDDICCSIPNCWNQTEKFNLNISTYPFPEQPDLREKWLKGISLPDFVPTKTSSVCERHFNKKDFILGEDGKISEILKSNAIPIRIKTELLDHNYEKTDFPLQEDDEDNRHDLPEDDRHDLPEDDRNNSQDDPLSDNEIIEKKIYPSPNFQPLLQSLTEQGVPPSWNCVVENSVIYVYSLDIQKNMSVKYSVEINSDMCINVFVRNIEISNIKYYKIPKQLTSYEDLLDVLVKVPNIDQNLKETRTHNRDIVEQIEKIAKNLLINKNNNNMMIKFLLEQFWNCVSLK